MPIKNRALNKKAGNNKESVCCKETCKKEAKKVRKAIRKLWKLNYGKGTNPHKDNVGGYLCWDWAWAFYQTITNLKPKCFFIKHKMSWAKRVDKDGNSTVHYYVTISVCKEGDKKCMLTLDDAWPSGEGIFVHGGDRPKDLYSSAWDNPIEVGKAKEAIQLIIPKFPKNPTKSKK